MIRAYDEEETKNSRLIREGLEVCTEDVTVAGVTCHRLIPLVIRVSEGTAHLGTHDPAKVAQALTNVLSQEDVVQHLVNTELSSQLVTALRGAIRLGEMRAAVAQFRELLNSGER